MTLSAGSGAGRGIGEVRRVSAATVLPLRAAVLRPGQLPAAAGFDEDDDRATIHLAVLDAAGEVVGCGTVFPAPYPGSPPVPGASWRLRGMATAPSVRGRGHGYRVLRGAVEAVQAEGGVLIWCHARVSADAFYDRAGLQVDGPEFVVPGRGSHRLRWITVGAGSGPPG